MTGFAVRADEEREVQTKTAEVDLFFERDLQEMSAYFKSDWFESTSTSGSIDGFSVESNGEESPTVPLSACSELTLNNLARVPADSIFDENGFLRSDTSSAMSHFDLISSASTSPVPRRTRYIRRENPTGHRKYQAWVKDSTILRDVNSEQTEHSKERTEMNRIGEYNTIIGEGKSSNVTDSGATSAKLPAKFRRGRRRKTVYKGPICYRCSRKHHIRDCGVRKLKGKRNKKGWNS
ncbi:hypothetical protein ONS95_014389 [Cadophora gregata]|uniref:uncharacterized protein n=1 Tax=Cadophora gregata TaxID=51156 RepID=UPI0026DCCACA|nr:uncharacterized protein ONS95_014389 [Cadophora gregata]KAK0112650.1 hypothetical protein ONS95_014389 [Cadophora gregata]